MLLLDISYQDKHVERRQDAADARNDRCGDDRGLAGDGERRLLRAQHARERREHARERVEEAGPKEEGEYALCCERTEGEGRDVHEDTVYEPDVVGSPPVPEPEHARRADARAHPGNNISETTLIYRNFERGRHARTRIHA